jgi:hypothetical protein
MFLGEQTCEFPSRIIAGLAGSKFPLAPGLQPGASGDQDMTNRFNGLSSLVQAVETAGIFPLSNYTGLKPRF